MSNNVALPKGAALDRLSDLFNDRFGSIKAGPIIRFTHQFFSVTSTIELEALSLENRYT